MFKFAFSYTVPNEEGTLCRYCFRALIAINPAVCVAKGLYTPLTIQSKTPFTHETLRNRRYTNTWSIGFSLFEPFLLRTRIDFRQTNTHWEVVPGWSLSLLPCRAHRHTTESRKKEIFLFTEGTRLPTILGYRIEWRTCLSIDQSKKHASTHSVLVSVSLTKARVCTSCTCSVIYRTKHSSSP